MEDPETFLENAPGKRLVFDEIQRLRNPSEILKIAADHFPQLKIIATGSSTLGASKKFRDTLTGRKEEIWLSPMISDDLKDFGKPNLQKRLLHGGLPPFYLPRSPNERDLQEWIDSYWARDIQELFRLEKRDSFQKFFELLMVQSGGIFEATRFAALCEASRPTIVSYLRVLEDTCVMNVVRPFSSRKQSEIVSAPKVYGFDTGFACYYKGWKSLRNDDMGLLWEHYVLNEIQARTQDRRIHYWRDKRGREIDFIIKNRDGTTTAIECKWTADTFDPKSILAFRKDYPRGKNFVVSSDTKDTAKRKYDGVPIMFVSLEGLIDQLI